MKDENNRHRDIREEVNRTMHSLDEVERAKAGAHFYDRLQARMNRDAARHPGLVEEPRFAWTVAAVLILVLVNILLVTNSVWENGVQSPPETEEIIVLVEAYDLSPSLVYEQNTEEE